MKIYKIILHRSFISVKELLSKRAGSKKKVKNTRWLAENGHFCSLYDVVGNTVNNTNGRGRRQSLHLQFFWIFELNEEIQELLKCYKVTDGIDDNLRERYVNKMDKGGDGLTPGLVGLRIPTIAKLPATFVPTIMKIKDNVDGKGHWKDL